MGKKVFFYEEGRRNEPNADYMYMPLRPEVGSIIQFESGRYLKSGVVYKIVEVMDIDNITIECLVLERQNDNIKQN